MQPRALLEPASSSSYDSESDREVEEVDEEAELTGPDELGIVDDDRTETENDENKTPEPGENSGPPEVATTTTSMAVLVKPQGSPGALVSTASTTSTVSSSNSTGEHHHTHHSHMEVDDTVEDPDAEDDDEEEEFDPCVSRKGIADRTVFGTDTDFWAFMHAWFLVFQILVYPKPAPLPPEPSTSRFAPQNPLFPTNHPRLGPRRNACSLFYFTAFRRRYHFPHRIQRNDVRSFGTTAAALAAVFGEGKPDVRGCYFYG